MKKIFSILMMIAATASAAAAQSAQAPKFSRKTIVAGSDCVSYANKGLEYLAEGDRESMDAAAHSFKKAVEAQYDCVAGLIGYAEVITVGKGYNMTNEEYMTAYEYVVRAIALDPKSAHAHWVLADLLRHANKPVAAISLAERSTKLDPSDPWTHYVLGSSLLQFDPELAIGEFKKALELKPGWKMVTLNLAAAYINVGNLSEAEKQLASIIKEDSGNLNALTNMGIVLIKAGKPDKAIEFLDTALRIDSMFPMALKARGDAAFAIKDFKSAIEYYGRFIQLYPREANVLVLLGDAFMASGDVNNARQAYSRALTERPDDPQIKAKVDALSGR